MSIALQIVGMTCGHCEMAVRKELASVPGVTQVLEVSKDRGEAVIEGKAPPHALISAVAKAGYEARIVG